MKSLIKGAALFLGGAAVGAAAVLLLAPKATEEIRGQIADLAAEAKKRAQECCEQVKQDLSQAEAAAEARDTNGKKEA